MALIEASAAGGKWSQTTAWVGEVVPGENDDVVLGAGSGSIKVEGTPGKCRSLEASAYKKTLTLNNELEVGAGNAGLGVKFGAGMTLAGSAALIFGGAAEVVSLTTAGLIPAIVRTKLSAKLRLEDTLKVSTALQVNEKSELNTNGKEVKTPEFNCAVNETAKVVLGASIIKINGTGANAWKAPKTLEAGTSTIELNDTSTTEKNFSGSGLTYNIVIFSGNNIKVEGNNTYATLEVSNSIARKTCKATLTALSNHLIVTENEGNLSNGVELEGTGIPAGTTIIKKVEAKVWEMSANATETVAVAETVLIFQIGLRVASGSIQTVTNFSTNGKESTNISRIAETTAGTAWKLKKTAGTVSIDWTRLRGSKAEGGANFYAGANSTNVATNTGWKFEKAKWEQTFEVSQGQSVTKKAEVARTLTVSQSQSITRSETLARSLTVSQAQSVTRSETVARTLSATQAQTVSKTVTVARVLSASQAQSVTRSGALARTLAAEQGQSATKTTSTAKVLSATQSASSVLAKTVGRILSAAQGATVSKAVALARTLSASQGQSASETKASTTTLSAAQGQSVVKRVTVARNLAAEQGQSALMARSLTRTLTLSQGQEATLTEVIIPGEKVLTCSQGQSVTLTSALARKLTASQGQTVARTTNVGRILSSSQSQATALSKALSRTLSASASSSARLAKLLARLLTASQGQEASQTHTGTFGRLLGAEQGQEAAMRRSLALTRRASQPQSAAVARSPTRYLSVTQGQTPRLVRALSRKLSLAQPANVTLSKRIGKVLVTVPVSSVIVGASVARVLEVSQASSATLEVRVAFYPGVLVSTLSWQRMASDSATGVASSTSSAILDSSDETSIASSVEPVVNVESRVE